VDIPTELPADDLEELYEHAPCGYISALPDGRIIRVNQTFVNLTGHDRDRLIADGVRISHLMTTPGRVFYDTHFAPLIRIQGFVREIAVDLVRPNQRPLPVLVNATQIKDAAGEPARIRFMVFDATERRRYEADLLAARRRAEHFEVIVQTSADAILRVDPDGSVRTWNPGAEKMFGYSASDAVGQKAWDVIRIADGEALAAETFPELLRGRTVSRDAICLTRDGGQLDMFITATPHIEPPGELTGVSAVIRDITSRKRIAEARHRDNMQQALLESLEAERRRISRDLHDHLGQQLTGLRLALADLRSARDGDMARRIDIIQEQALAIDRDLGFLAFDLRPTKLAESGLAEALDELVRGWKRHYLIDAELIVHRVDGRRLAPATEVNLYRIAQEALNNTVKHARATSVSLIYDEGPEEVALIVEDDGVGFDPEMVSLEPASSEGGLGLAGMHERAAIVGGHVEIESTPAAGTTIFVHVPTTFI
jgi:two-component system, NarL family, sensor histidine kinase UhpB